MGRIADWIQALALGLGAPGLFLVGFLDSSVLSLPEINDLLLVWMVTQHKSRMLLYATAATVGSLVGCLLLYYLGLKGGEALARRRFSTDAVERTLGVFQRHGAMAVLIPSLLPPPAPFKIFVLLAGIAEIRASRFVTAIVIGRGVRYLVLGMLAVWYGDSALEFIHTHSRTISLAVAVLLAAALLGYLVWAKARTRTGR
jgi:membrane protein YqaA with SNARE-associated domain